MRVFESTKFLIILLVVAYPTTSLGSDPHEKVFASSEYPSAHDCGTCHPKQFSEWSSSPHAYAQLSPVFGAMHRKLVQVTNGTMGDFCIRCHTPVGMDAGQAISKANEDRKQQELEGVTCISCHRRSEPLGKVSGRINIETGDITQPVSGPFDNEELKKVINSGEYEVTTDSKSYGRKIHKDVIQFVQISESGFCGACHDVHAVSGLRLEEAFSEYKASPASGNNVRCHDCHMGSEQGVVSKYTIEPIAIVGGKPTKPRPHANHSFVGPDYSIVHPGLFPHSYEATELASVKEWIQFDYKAGWGTDDFEDTVEEGYLFPARWKDAADRYDARAIIDENLVRLDEVADARKELLGRGYQLGKINIDEAGSDGISFEVEFKNGTDGHNVPTGFDAERLVFLRVEVLDANNKQVFISGDLDPNGDLRDEHSLYVHGGEIDKDAFLFSLQSKFLVNMMRGGEREQVLPVDFSNTPLPFVRPPLRATTLRGRPNMVRKHRKTIPPKGSIMVPYQVSADALEEASFPCKIKVQIVTGMIPVNLINAIKDVGFDYKMSARDVAEAVVAGHQVVSEKEVSVSGGS